MAEKSDSEQNSSAIQAAQNSDDQFVHDWADRLLSLLGSSVPEETQKHILKGCAAIHYDRLHMEEMTSQYRGNLEGFLKVLAEKWGWLVVYDPETNTITADENKKECVCPLVRLSPGPISAVLCHCSEGFGERMFSEVVGRPVKAQVMRSILRGNPTCVYRIQI